MRQSQLFCTTRREAPAGEESKNAILLTRGGYIDKELAGVYSLLPLAVRVVEKIKIIIREELSKLPHTSEVLMPVLQPHALWEESGRREDIKEIMYDLKNEPLGLGPTHEEVITDLFRRFFSSYKDLPKAAYQIQTKFRNEPRAKSGLLRGREFLMKDLYSFHETEESLAEFYDLVKDAYFRIFEHIGLEAVLTEASGGLFSKFSHEFQIINESGEDTIYLNQVGDMARNQEIVDQNDPAFLQWSGGYITPKNAIEVGNIFKLNRKFSVPLHVQVATKNGEQTDVWTASYGIGVTRLVGTLAEVYGDLEKGSIKWPRSVAPYRIHLIEIGTSLGQDLYNQLVKLDSSDVLYDDRDVTPGTKFADADLIGAPIRIVVSPRTTERQSVELNGELVKSSELMNELTNI